MRITEIAEGVDVDGPIDLDAAIKAYEDRDKHRASIWRKYFKSAGQDHLIQ